MTLRSEDIFYLNYEGLQNFQDVDIKSKTGHVTINKLFLVIFSPMLKQTFASLEEKIDDNFTIITDFEQEDIETIANFCYGYLPLPYDSLSKSVPLKLRNVFQAFGIDLQKVLFSEDTFKIEPVVPTKPTLDDFIAKSEPENDDGFDSEQYSDEDSEDEPIAKKRKKIGMKRVKNETNQSQLLSKYQNYVQIQEKYKNYLSVTIPNIGDPDPIKFSSYVPVEPIETFWKPPRPPSRKKKKPKGYDKYPLSCKLCSKRFTSEILQSFHIKVYHNPHFQCPYCPNAFYQEDSAKFKKHLFNHEHVTKTSIPHECIQCGKQDYCLQRLQKHIDNFRGPFHSNQCTQCLDTFQTHQAYQEHVNLVHHGVWKFRCDECEEVFDSLELAKEHRLAVHKRKQPPKHTVPTMCDICGKVLKGSSIPNHMKLVHMTEVPDTPCPHCGKVVKELQRHIKRSHEKLPCDLCGKLVPPGHMLRHNDQYHTAPEERRYKCELCNKGFSTKQRLTDHVHTHTGEKPYTCQYCGKGFANSSGCRLHVRFTHLGQKRLRKK